MTRLSEANLDQWAEAARIDLEAGASFSAHPSAILELVAEVRLARSLVPPLDNGPVIIVTFAEDPELVAQHRPAEHAPGRPACSCGWYAIPGPSGRAGDEAALLAHRRESSRRRVTIEADYYLAWADQFGTGQYVANGPTGDRHLADLKAHAEGQ